MKIKLDFVTNSSSTCFIVSHKNTKDVAMEMVKIIFKEWDQYNYKKDKKFENMIFKNIKKLPENENIMIPFSTNYETFIFNNNNTIYVDTCTNHDWWGKLDVSRDLLKDELDDFENLENSLEFVNIRDNTSGSMNQLIEIELKKIKDQYDEN